MDSSHSGSADAIILVCRASEGGSSRRLALSSELLSPSSPSGSEGDQLDSGEVITMYLRREEEENGWRERK